MINISKQNETSTKKTKDFSNLNPIEKQGWVDAQCFFNKKKKVLQWHCVNRGRVNKQMPIQYLYNSSEYVLVYAVNNDMGFSCQIKSLF